MAVLWTDIVNPAELTGYARASLNDYEARQGSLARWLPNREVQDVVARFVAGGAGLVEEARYRAYDAEPEVGRTPGRKRVTIELPAVSQEIPVTEYQQLRERGARIELFRKRVELAVLVAAEIIAVLRGKKGQHRNKVQPHSLVL